VALGGNAITVEGEAGTHEQQRAHAAEMARSVSKLLEDGWRVVVVHGNGPQVGSLAIQQEAGGEEVPPMPLFALDAMTQGQLGSLIALELRNLLGAGHAVVALVTHIAVELDDPAFSQPTKPIGPFFSERDAARHAHGRGWQVAADVGRGHRRVVASPRPRDLLELEAVRLLLDAGHLVVAAGGGGIPVARRGDGWEGVDAVIDKDFAAAELASRIDAEALLLVTGVDGVMVDFGKASQRRLGRTDLREIERHRAAGQFPRGSMGPKVAAAAEFIRAGGNVAVVTTADLAAATLRGLNDEDASLGTRIVARLPGEGVA
jgi:carbamate kinase